MTIKLKPITETSWLVLGDTEDTRIGLLTQMKNEYILMVKGEKRKFIDRKEVNKYFSEDVFENLVDIPTETKKEYFIKGYPVDFDNPYEVSLPGNNLPLFSKKESSTIYYSAGYYCFNFPTNWMLGFCPKLSTLETHEYVGPFKDKFSATTELTRLRKERSSKK